MQDAQPTMPSPRTYGLTHIALAVRDVERTLAFYRQVFDMETMYHQPGFVQVCTPGCNDILVFEERDADYGLTGGIAHFGFRLRDPADAGAIAENVRRAGGVIDREGEFCPGSPFLFFRDPDGYEIEVWFEAIPDSPPG